MSSIDFDGCFGFDCSAGAAGAAGESTCAAVSRRSMGMPTVVTILRISARSGTVTVSGLAQGVARAMRVSMSRFSGRNMEVCQVVER